MFTGVLNTKKQLCSQSNTVEMVCSYADIVTENTNIAIGGRYSKYFIELFFLELFRRPFPVQDAQESGSNHAQATNLRFNWIIIIQDYMMSGTQLDKAFKRGTLVEKPCRELKNTENSNSDSNTLYLNNSISK